MILFDKFVGIDTWWYLSTSCLIIGFNVAEYKDKILNLNPKKIKMIFIIAALSVIILLILLNYSLVAGKNPIFTNNNGCPFNFPSYYFRRKFKFSI